MAAAMTPALSRFAEIARNHHQYAKDWQARSGGKVLGYFCTYVPEEIVHAAGLLSVRILGSGDYPEEADSCVGSTWCAFSRDCLAQGLRGQYDYLDGVVYANSCHHMMQAFDAWVRHVPTRFSYFLDLPWDVAAPAAHEYSKREIRDFRTALEGHVGHPITDAEIERSIAIFDENRHLLRELYDLRRSPKPSISGSEVLHVMLANQYMDKEEHSTLLRQLLDELKGRQIDVPDLRFMVVGSEIDDIRLMEKIESLGALVVTDEQCIGSRYFWNETPAGDDVLMRIGDRYLARPPCPLKDWRQPRLRVDHLLALAKDYKVDGVIFLIQKFCDPHGWDTPYIQKVLEQNKIPNIALEITIPNPMGPLQTRLEAFIEMLVLDLV